MGNVITYSQFFSQDKKGFLKPIIYCNPKNEIIDVSVSLNYKLANSLSLVKEERRSMRLALCFEEILRTLPDNAVIKDFDAMFNPEYKVDVLKIMVAACKKKPFSIIWPGKYEAGKLFYAEDSYMDFKTFYVEDYDVICIV